MSATPICRTAAVRAIEAAHAACEPPLMDRAGAAVAALAGELLGDARQPVLIVCGPGNNGGDGFVAARLLKEMGRAVSVVFAGEADRLPRDARGALEEWRMMGGQTLADIPAAGFALAIDALFGIGLSRPADGRAAALIARLNDLDCPILAVDIPSGLCADTGRRLGPTIRATHTLSFIAGKPGLYTLDGPDCCGEVRVDGLGLDLAASEGWRIDRALFRTRLQPRPRNCHKGSFGSAGIVGGAPGMAGAALLAGRAALQLGAGRVHVGMLERLPVDPAQPELMLRETGEAIRLATALAVGPGLGGSAAALAALRQAIGTRVPLLLDADALNLLARHPVNFAQLARREAATVLTPHPAEAARLLGREVDAVQADRLGAALDLAARSRAIVVLKGCGSVVAVPGGPYFINGTGSPGLATAGSGDVLSGLLVALLAQGWPAREAALAAVHLHGAAADWLAGEGVGPVGLAAGELIPAARRLFNGWLADV